MNARTAAVFAIASSMALHAVAMVPFGLTDEVLVEGGGGKEMARLGNGFADVSEGVTTAVSVSAENALRPAAPVAVTPPARTVTAPSEPGAVPAPAPVAADAVLPEVLAPVESAETLQAQPEVVVREATPETPRPRPRQEPKPEPERTPAQAGAERSTRRGQDAGREEAQATQATGAATAAAGEGNAAVSNYPGEVLRKLSRTRRPVAGRRGTAFVGFEIAASGALVRSSVLRSSGVPEVDRAALEHVARAAPFPPPPPGAQRRFQVRYDSTR